MSTIKKDVCIQFGVEEMPAEDEAAPAEREWKFIEKDSFSDLKLIVKDKEFFCHKIMLSNCSPVFRAMLLGNFTEKSKSEIEIKDVEPENMEVFLQAVYNPSFKCTSEVDSKLILPLANFYQVTHLVKELENFFCESLLVRSDKCIEYLQMVRNFNLPKIKQSCLDIMARGTNSRYITAIKENDDLKEFESELLRTRVRNLEDILKNIELSMTNPCSKVEKKEIRVPVNFCSDHTGPLTIKENGEVCSECVKKLKSHIKNVCTTEKIRTTINYNREPS